MKAYKLVVLSSIVFGLLLLLPYLAQRIEFGSQFGGLYSPVADDQAFYMSRIQDVLDGHPLLSNSYLFEHKDGLPEQVFLAEYLLAQPLKFFHLTVQEGVLAYTFLCGALIFLLTYEAFFVTSKSHWLALAATAVLSLGFLMVRLDRIVSPQFNLIFFISLFILLWRCLESGAHTKWFILGGINLGFLFYLYPFYWSYYLIVIALMFVFVRRVWITLAVGGIVAIPYVLMSMKASRLPEYPDTLLRFVVHSHFPSGINVMLWSLIPLGLIIYLVWRRTLSLSRETLFFASALLGSAIAVNQHVITGSNFEFSSHYYLGAVFVGMLSLVWLLGRAFALFPRRSILVVGASLVGVAIIVYGSVSFVRVVSATPDREYALYAPLMRWLDEHGGRDDVVLAPEALSEIIPSFTSQNVLFAHGASLFYVTNQEIADRFIINHYFETIDEAFIRGHERELFGTQYIDGYNHVMQENKMRKLFGLPLTTKERIPEVAIERVLKRSQELHKVSFKKLLSEYRVDFVIEDRRNPQFNGMWQAFHVASVGPYEVFHITDALAFAKKGVY